MNAQNASKLRIGCEKLCSTRETKARLPLRRNFTPVDGRQF